MSVSALKDGESLHNPDDEALNTVQESIPNQSEPRDLSHAQSVQDNREFEVNNKRRLSITLLRCRTCMLLQLLFIQQPLNGLK